MLGSKPRGQSEFLMAGSLRDLIPNDHILVRVDRVLDLSWLRAEVRSCYAVDGAGRPGIDPEVAIRLMLAGFLLGIVHDRRLLREAQVNIAIRWFAGFGLYEVLPDHSSLTRIRQRWGADLFRQVFTRTVQSCVAAGIAKGEVVHIDATLIRADVAWESLGMQHVDAVLAQDGDDATDPEAVSAKAAKRQTERDGKQSGKHKKICLTDPDATMATNARNRRLEPAYKQHTAVDDVFGVVLDVEVTTGQANEGDHVLPQVDAVAAATNAPVKVVTADQGYAYGKVYGGLERRGVDPVIPAKKEPIRSRVPLRRFRYDAKHDILKCPQGRVLRPRRRVPHGRFFYSRSSDCRRCPMRGDCLSAGRVNKAVVVSDDHPALLRARRRKERWSKEDARLYQRHRWRSEGFHGEAKSWHGLARAIRRGLQNMRIQAFLTAAAINLKRLAKALGAIFVPFLELLLAALRDLATGSKKLASPLRRCAISSHAAVAWPRPGEMFFNSPRVHWMRNALSYVPKGQQSMVSAALRQAFIQPDRAQASQTLGAVGISVWEVIR
jgi:transposase